MEPWIQVVIPTASLGPRLDGLLADLARELAGTDAVQVTVADAHAVYDLTPELLGTGPHTEHVQPSPVNGPAVNRNRGAHAATADWLVFLDDDVRLPAGWFAGLSAALADPACPDLLGGGIASQHPRNWFSQAAEDFVVRHRRYPEGWYLAAAHLAVRRTAFRTLDGFTTEYDYGGEDWDLCRRAHAAGLTVGVTDRASVAHANPRTWAQLALKARQYGTANAVLDAALAAGPADAPLERTAAEAAGHEPSAAPRRGPMPVRAARWVASEYRLLRTQGRGRLRATRSTALYVPWMATYLRAAAGAAERMADAAGRAPGRRGGAG
jgi:GT2 family glycosyltransferase